MIYTKLMSHQKMICEFMRDKKYGAIFADYGTGKTLCALSHIDQMVPQVRKILVVSSKTAILSTWPDEIKKHTNFRYVILQGTSKQKVQTLQLGLRKSYIPETAYSGAVTAPILFLINFEGIRSIYDYLAQANFSMIIVDESTKIKSPKAQRSKVLWALGRTAERRWIMTGFPVTENLMEIFSQIKFLDYGESLGPKYFPFLEKFFYRAGFKRKPKIGAEKKIFKLIKGFAIRVTNDVLGLPPKVYQTKKVQPSTQQIEMLSQLRDYFAVELGKVKIDTQYIFSLINKSLQICDGFIQEGWARKDGPESCICVSCKRRFKIEIYEKSRCPKCGHKGFLEVIDTSKDSAIIDLVEEIDPLKNKIVIWAVYRFTVKKLKKIFQKLGYKVLTLTGETENVNKVVKQFQNSSDKNILIATQKKASESVTLTACRYAIYYSNTWSYDLRANSEARIRRKGSERHRSINYTDLIMEDSIESLVYDCLRRKRDLVGDLKKEFGALKVKKEK